MRADWHLRLRGVDRWSQATAIVRDVELIDTEKGKNAKKLAFTYSDHTGSLQVGREIVSRDMDLFNVRVGEQFQIYFDPSKPHRYFIKARRSDLAIMVVAFLLPFLALVLALLLFKGGLDLP